MNEFTRRNVLVGTAGLTTAVLAGCVSDTGDDSGGNDDGGTNNGGIEDSSITLVGSDCAGPDPDTVIVVVDGNTYTIEGILPSNTPCYEPALVEASGSGGTLSLSVDIVETRTDDEGCVDCEGQVEYEATVTVAETATVERVSVTHESGESHAIDRSEFVEGQPEIISSSIETTRTDSRTDEHSETAELDRENGTVTIEGTILTSTPHYEAVLTETAIERRTLQVTIDVESTLDEDEMGTQQLGFLDYKATIELENIDSLKGANVQHPESAHGFAWDEDSASASGSRTVAVGRDQ